MKTSTIAVAIVVGAMTLLWGVEASLLVSDIAPLQENTSCAGRCNVTGTIPGAPCQCNAFCLQFNDCCEDYYSLCLEPTPGSCVGRCDQPNNPGASCQCNKPCVNFGDCCPDYEDVCNVVVPEPITNAELAALSEELYVLEGPNNAYRYIQVSSLAKEGFNSSEGILNLLSVDPAAYELETIKKLIALFDNYSPAVCNPEIFTSQQQAELDDFIDAVFATPIMIRTQEFLASKGLLSGRSNFVQIWIDQYSRCSGTLGSSGLEHILLGELNNNGVSGFHNWVFFAKGEEAGDVVYGSASDFVEFGEKGAAIEFGFTWLGNQKPKSSIYIGTSPELELALNTIAFYARPNAKTPVSLNSTTIQIQTYDITNNGLKYVASGYPDLSN